MRGGVLRCAPVPGTHALRLRCFAGKRMCIMLSSEGGSDTVRTAHKLGFGEFRESYINDPDHIS